MKKLISTVLIFGVLTAPILAPKRADAFIGICIGDVPMIVVGGILFLGSAISLESGAYDYPTEQGFGVWNAVGIVLLNQNENGVVPSFVALSADQASALNISANELNSYNSELDEINAIAQSVTSELSAEATPTVVQSHALWDAYKNSISTDAFSATQKIAAQFVKKQ